MTKFIESPVKGGGLYIEKKLIPITFSNNPKLILEELKDRAFMFLSRYITDRPTEIYGTKVEQKKYLTNEGMVIDGLEIASRFHPDTYECFNHGICTIQRRCPSSTNEVCCLCPHLIFNLVHIEGILYKHQHTILEMKFIQDKLVIAQQKGDSSTRTEMQKLHNAKVNELIGWSEMIEMISKNFKKIGNSNQSSHSNQLKVIKKDEEAHKFIFSRTVEEEEMIMELLLKAETLKIDTPETDNLVNRISSKIILKAIRDKDTEILNRMEKDGLKWIIKSYGKKAIAERKEFLELFISDDIEKEKNQIESTQNKKLIQQKNN
jgi:hypothetical protein